VFKLTEDGSPGKVLLSKTPNKADSLSDEQEFLQATRQHDAMDPKTGSLHPTIPLVAWVRHFSRFFEKACPER